MDDRLPTTLDASFSACETGEQPFEVVLSTLGALAGVLRYRDADIVRHQQRVGALAYEIGERLGLDPDRLLGLRIAAEMHDVGKWALPEEILRKPGPLSDAEFSLVSLHATTGFGLLQHVSFPWPVAEAVRQHHERIDGSGYPQGLLGESILLEARIIAVADVLEAMSSAKPYRRGLGIDAALAELVRGSGTAYDPLVVDACIELFASGIAAS